MLYQTPLSLQAFWQVFGGSHRSFLCKHAPGFALAKHNQGEMATKMQIDSPPRFTDHPNDPVILSN